MPSKWKLSRSEQICEVRNFEIETCAMHATLNLEGPKFERPLQNLKVADLADLFGPRHFPLGWHLEIRLDGRPRPQVAFCFLFVSMETEWKLSERFLEMRLDRVPAFRASGCERAGWRSRERTRVPTGSRGWRALGGVHRNVETKWKLIGTCVTAKSNVECGLSCPVAHPPPAQLHKSEPLLQKRIPVTAKRATALP